MKIFGLIDLRIRLLKLWFMYNRMPTEAIKARAKAVYGIAAATYNEQKYWWMFEVNINLK